MTTTTDYAQVLEDAADLLLIHGVRRDGQSGSEGWDGSSPLCVYGAAIVATDRDLNLAYDAVDQFAKRHVGQSMFDHDHPATPCDVFAWNDRSTDDFEVIDALRKVAKDLRNGE